jgi:tetratricopeptide (TPR) repeat protein
LFRTLGLYPGPDICVPAAASLAGLPVAGTRRLLAELTRASLLAESRPGRYTCHDLLRAYAAELAQAEDPAAARRAARTRLLDHYVHTAYAANQVLERTEAIALPLAPPAPGARPQRPSRPELALRWFTTELPVIRQILAHYAGPGYDTGVWQLAWAVRRFLQRRGQWHDFAVTSRAALRAARRLGEPALQAFAHRALVNAHTQLHTYRDAERHARQALDLYARAGDLVGAAYTHGALARLRDKRNQHADAVQEIEKARALFAACDDQIGLQHCLNALAWHLAHLGRTPEARTYADQAWTLNRRLRDRASEANIWDTLGYINHRLGDRSHAIRCFHHALTASRRAGDRSTEADVLTHLGDTHHAAGDLDAARAAWRQALEVVREFDGTVVTSLRRRLSVGFAARSGPAARKTTA